jgi:Fur family transcriptional regulator, ferric uptake regulator
MSFVTGARAMNKSRRITTTTEKIEQLQAEVARRLGYRLVDHRLELYAVPLDDKKPR